MLIHKVTRGEDVYSVAAEYGITPERLRESNGICGDRLATGDRLIIAIPTRTHSVRARERFEDVCARFKIRAEELLAQNPELHGIPRVYTGQVLTVRSGESEYGMAAANGYLYSGATRADLVRAMPYIDYLTVSAGVIRGSEVGLIFDDRTAVEAARAAGKQALLRVYSRELPSRDSRGALLDAITLVAKSHGYSGVTLGGGISSANGRDGAEYVLEAKRRLMECDLALFTEGAADGDLAHTEFSDGCVLTYDRLHLDPQPSFANGERRWLTEFAEGHDSPRAFVDLSPFAYLDGRYITKSRARALATRKGCELSHDEDAKVLSCALGGRRSATLRFESAESTKAKLELVSELGFMGICFDIGRLEPQDLCAFRSMFARVPAIYERPIV